MLTNMMAAALHVGVWTGVKNDEEAAEDLAMAKQADVGAVMASKMLVPKSEVAALQREHFAARRDFKRLTLPFEQGMGIVPVGTFLDFRANMAKHQAKFGELADTFCNDVYPEILAKAVGRMGSLYRPEDYPPASALRHRYYMDVRLMPVPEAAELKLSGIEDAVQEQLREEYETQLQGRLAEAQADVLKRLLKPVAKFVETLGDSDAAFKRSTVDNLMEMVQLAPKMLLQHDEDVSRWCDKIKARLGMVDTDALRLDQLARTDVVEHISEVRAELERKLATMGFGR